MKTFLRSTVAATAGVLLPAMAHADLIYSSDRPSSIPAQTDFRIVILRIINYVLTFVGLIAVGFLIYAGFLYLFAGANPDGTKKAKEIIFNSIIGIIIILLSWVIVNTVITQLSDTISG